MHEIENNNSGITYDDVDMKDALNPIDFGVALGTGYELASGININLRVIYGLIGVNDLTQDPDAYVLNNLVGQLSLGFPLIAM